MHYYLWEYHVHISIFGYTFTLVFSYSISPQIFMLGINQKIFFFKLFIYSCGFHMIHPIYLPAIHIYPMPLQAS